MALKKKIFIVQPLGPFFEAVYPLIRDATVDLSYQVEVFRADDIPSSGKTIIEKVYDSLETTDLIICDISESNPNVMYELGYAHGVRKPVILISRKPDYVPFDIRSVHTVYYDIDFNNAGDFIVRLSKLMQEALDNPEAFSSRPSIEMSVNSVFISYSHKDKLFLDRLMIHLQPLEKEGLIDLWADTKLKAGDKWKVEIEQALDRARVGILLITADFLASNFIVDNELPPLLSKAESQGTRIIPVVLKPCRFTRDKNLNGFHAINNPNEPLATLSEPEQERIYDKISELVERSVVR